MMRTGSGRYSGVARIGSLPLPSSDGSEYDTLTNWPLFASRVGDHRGDSLLSGKRQGQFIKGAGLVPGG